MTDIPNQYGQTSVDGLRIFLEFWPKFKAEYEEFLQTLPADKELLFNANTVGFSWCHLYELPFKQHSALSYQGFLEDERFLQIFKNLISSHDQAAFLPELITQVDNYFDEMEPPSKEEALDIMPILPAFLGVSLSSFHSLRSVLYYGYFLNELIDQVREGSDQALFNAVRIDPTVIGCKPVIQRISKAVLMQEVDFMDGLKKAINGKFGKRDEDNFQKMRLIFEVLSEAKATRLNDEQLYQLFVEELAIYEWDALEGGKAKSLRKFADTYMKKSQNSTT
jgi:hypothetical protein